MTPTVGWDASEADRLAEVNHVDGNRRPWRSAGVALAACSLGVMMVPRPLSVAALGAIAVGTTVAAVAAWRFPIIRGRREPRRADLAVGADADGVVIVRDGLVRRLAPRSIARLVVGSDHVFLHLADGALVTVPTRVFAARGALDRFVDAVERFGRNGAPPTDTPAPGFDRWSLVYGLGAGGLGPQRDRAGDRERAWLVGFSLLSFGGLLASTEPWRGGLDLVLFALFGAIGVVFAVTGRARWAPVGPVALCLGPDGGWMQTEDGTARFDWAAVRSVEIVADGFVLRFGDHEIPIPGAALPADRARLLDDVGAWWRAVRVPPGDGSPPGPSVSGPPDPFAPPAGN